MLEPSATGEGNRPPASFVLQPSNQSIEIAVKLADGSSVGGHRLAVRVGHALDVGRIVRVPK